jgi:hypothetical protein
MRQFWLLALGPILLTVGCNRYEITLNDQPLHSPPLLFTGYRINDTALRDCVAQTVRDNKIIANHELTRLLCTHAGIRELKGLEIFGALETLNLADNSITNVEPLLSLPSLTQLDLSTNPDLDCAAATALTIRGVVVALPTHCLK